MKQKILKTLALGLLLVSGVSGAWAENTVTITDGTTTEYYETLKAAIAAETSVLKSPTGNVTITLSADQSLGDKVVSWDKLYTLTIVASKDITVKGPNGSRWFTVKYTNSSDVGCNLIVGDGSNTITLDGENKTRTAPVGLRSNKSNITFKNVVFKNFDLNNATDLVVGENQDGVITIDQVTIENCVKSKNGFIYNQRLNSDKIVLKGYLNLDETSYQSSPALCTTNNTTKDTENGRIKVDDDSFTAERPLKIKWVNMPTTIGYGPLVVGISKVSNPLSIFDVESESYGLYKVNGDLKLTQAYTLDVTEAKASTLILPFEAKIPADVTAYTLNYTSGASAVTATEVTGGTLAANIPVLINAEEGAYKFVSTATSGDLATGSGTHKVGALTGVYAETVPGTGHYILTNHSGSVGFRMTVASSKVAAYRAYLTADSEAREFLDIDFSEDNVTAIKNVKVGSEDNVYYDLQGRRVLYPKKGLYIVNGKKVIIK